MYTRTRDIDYSGITVAPSLDESDRKNLKIILDKARFGETFLKKDNYCIYFKKMRIKDIGEDIDKQKLFSTYWRNPHFCIGTIASGKGFIIPTENELKKEYYELVKAIWVNPHPLDESKWKLVHPSTPIITEEELKIRWTDNINDWLCCRMELNEYAEMIYSEKLGTLGTRLLTCIPVLEEKLKMVLLKRFHKLKVNEELFIKTNLLYIYVKKNKIKNLLSRLEDEDVTWSRFAKKLFVTLQYILEKVSSFQKKKQ
jgi:hypothetical protein